MTAMPSAPTVPARRPAPVSPAARNPGAFVFPASSAQQRLWLLEQMQPGRPLYHVPIAVRLEGPLDAAILEGALNDLVERHEILRTGFALEDNLPVQVVAPVRAVGLPVTDLRGLAVEAREARACGLAQEEARRPFDLRHPPLLRGHLITLADTSHILVLVLHHIVFDGWSLTIFFRELAACYEARRAGRPAGLPDLPVQYADYAAWQRQRARAQPELLAWWRENLAGSPAALELPADHPRPAVQGYHGRVETLPLPAGLRAPLDSLARREGVTPFMILFAAFQVLLHRYTAQDDILVGSPVAGRTLPETEGLVGLFINTLVLRGDLSGNPTFRALLARVKATVVGALAHEELPFDQLVEKLSPERSLSRSPLFQVMFVHERAPLEPVAWPGLQLQQLELDAGTAKFDLTLYLVEGARRFTARAEYDSALFEPATIRRLLGHYGVLLQGALASPDRRIDELPLLTPAESLLLAEWNGTEADYPRDGTVPGLIAAQAARTPDAIAVIHEDESLTYRELDERAERLARHLHSLGAGRDTIVGICVERSIAMMTALLGILKTGAAYLPLDPKFPPERLAYIVQDARAQLVLTQEKFTSLLTPGGGRLVCLDSLELPPPAAGEPPLEPPAAGQPAYVIYTSGSTGNPKGVAVTHRNVMNFFAGMDRTLGAPGSAEGGSGPGCWLAVTTISFDISVLELFWTLARGFKVVLQSDDWLGAAPPAAPAPAGRMDFSLFYFASEEENAGPDKYRLLMEGAKLADQHGFAAVWTPERHFHSFGGLFPNPSVTSAAIAMLTKRIRIRAGSVVLPLHNPIRVAEEWAVVDNFSQGRVDISFASGWHTGDFVLAPQNYAGRKDFVFREIETLRRLWRGDLVRIPGGVHGAVEIRIHPRPVQPELPAWITAAGDVETFRRAGEQGLHVITHLLTQDHAELADKIRVYREAWHRHGHPAAGGRVAVMLHTFVGPDAAEVRATVREPLRSYLRNSLELVRSLTGSAHPGLTGGPLAPAELEALVDSAFDRYFERCGLFGTPESCRARVEKLASIGADEIACLIDFGIETDTVLAGLGHLNRLRELAAQPRPAQRPRSIAEQIVRHQVTHLQCTPSLARILLGAPDVRAALARLDLLLLGGEPLPPPLAEKLLALLPGRLCNMYGPTETTVWSTTHRVEKGAGPVSIGRPIANTQVHILDRHLQPLPVGVPGELYLGGDGVAQGYLNRPELTAEKFLPDPFAAKPGARLYRTGDLARFRANGEIEFLGRADHQVKVRGFRIELGEIESVLRRAPGVREAVVVVREDTPGDPQLVAYLAADAAAAPAELRRALREKLPDYMVPGAFVVLPRLPLTPNGKIDRRALPPPGPVNLGPAASGALREGLERHLAAIWEEVLGIKNPGADDNFFDLGGHSLRVAQVHAKLRERLNLDLPILALFQHPTIHALARCINEKNGAAPLRLPAVSRTARARATHRPQPHAAPATP